MKAQLPVCEKDLISEIFTVFKLILVNPATNAVSERSFFTARHLKAWLRSSMNQIRFNNLATLMIHSDRTANIDLDEVASEFASRNDNRKRYIINFIVHLACICTRVTSTCTEVRYNLIEYKNLPPHFIIPSAGPACQRLDNLFLPCPVEEEDVFSR